MISDLSDLLHETDCSLEELQAVVDDALELDGSLEVDAESVSLVVDLFWTAQLRYPFTLEQFWQALDELDEESVEAYAWYEQQGLPLDGGRQAVHRAVLTREVIHDSTTRTP